MHSTWGRSVLQLWFKVRGLLFPCVTPFVLKLLVRHWLTLKLDSFSVCSFACVGGQAGGWKGSGQGKQPSPHPSLYGTGCFTHGERRTQLESRTVTKYSSDISQILIKDHYSTALIAAEIISFIFYVSGSIFVLHWIGVRAVGALFWLSTTLHTLIRNLFKPLSLGFLAVSSNPSYHWWSFFFF